MAFLDNNGVRRLWYNTLNEINKLKTHWKEEGYPIILEEQTISGSSGYELTGLLGGVGVTPSTKWKITFNGVEYICQGATGGSGMADCYMGNLALYDSTYTATPEYPFCIYSQWYSMPLTYIYFADNINSFTLKIEDMAGNKTIIYHTISEDYLPNTVVKKKIKETGNIRGQYALSPNAEYRINTAITNITFKLPEDEMYETWIRFMTGENPSIYFSAGTQFLNAVPEFEANTTYELTIKDGIVGCAKVVTA